MRITNRMTWATLALSAAVFGCGDNGDGGSTTGVGGSNGVGGSSAKPGSSTTSNVATGGSSHDGTGGAAATGGAKTDASATGGKSSTGSKSSATGGQSATGGASATGGKSSTGGTTGNSESTGGKAAGGSSQQVTGGSKATGGSDASGGKASGGSSTTGGTTAASGGSSSSAATGGKTGTGGSSSAGGSAAFKCVNLSMAPKTTGSKPSGAAGGLKVLDWAGFKGAVSFTFDDNMTTGSYAKFKATGAHVTFMVTSAMGNYAGYTGAPANGDEIGNHSSTHDRNGNAQGYQAMQDTIKTAYGVTPFTGASPYGDASWVAPAKGFFIAHRGVSDSDIKPRTASDNLLFNLPAYIPNSNESSSNMSSHIKDGIWKVFCVHGFASPAYNPVGESDMINTMTKAVSDGYWTETMGNVAAYFIGQNAISASATTSATWTLPANFPPNMCVRITTTGGTVTQNGQEVPWDEHGYYQISLDAKSVTIQ